MWLKMAKDGDGRQRQTKLYRCWRNMRSRCLSKRSPKWQFYGGRGITICDEWKTFEGFRKWAIANGVKRGLSIDRIDNDGDYCPENCRWTTTAMQNRNRSITKLTEKDIERIRRSNLHVNDLALHYSVDPSHVLRIVSGEKWKPVMSEDRNE